MFLAKASGQNIQTPTPITREEIFLSKITGGVKVEGTAIPAGSAPQNVYFNLNNTIEQTNAYLSQLTYVQTDLFEHPICGICGYLYHDNPRLMFATHYNYSLDGMDVYGIYLAVGATISKIFDGSYWGNEYFENKGFTIVDSDPILYFCHRMIFLPNAIADEVVELTDFMGLPIGAENEKIKNVLSITPFTGTTTSNKPTAYTVSSVDELPSDAVDGSLAVVEGSNDILGTYKLNSRATLENLTHLIEPDAYYEWTVKGYATNRDGIKTQFAYIYISWDAGGWCDGVGAADDNLSTDCGLYGNVGDPFFVNIEKFVEYITIEEEPTDNDAITFIRDNCVKTNSLYTRENGSWVYKCEVT